MTDFYGTKKQFEDIPAPNGKKLIGTCIELKESKAYEGCITLTVDFPEFKKTLDNGKEITKKGFYLIPLDWTAQNKAGRLIYSLSGKFPAETEQVNWTKLLFGKKLVAIFEATFDEVTGEEKGQKIKWLGSANAPEEKIIPIDEEVPF